MSTNVYATPLRRRASNVSISPWVEQSGVSCFSFTINLSASISNCFAFSVIDTSHSRDVQRSGARYFNWRDSHCWAHVSSNACDGSICRSMTTPASRLLSSTILASRSTWGIFRVWTASGFVTCSFNWLRTKVCPSNSSRFSTAWSPKDAMASNSNTSCDTYHKNKHSCRQIYKTWILWVRKQPTMKFFYVDPTGWVKRTGVWNKRRSAVMFF